MSDAVVRACHAARDINSFPCRCSRIKCYIFLLSISSLLFFHYTFHFSLFSFSGARICFSQVFIRLIGLEQVFLIHFSELCIQIILIRKSVLKKCDCTFWWRCQFTINLYVTINLVFSVSNNLITSLV